jgi:hypothetical protein
MDNFLSIFRPGLDPRNRTRLLGVGLAYFFAHQLAFLFPDSAGMLVAVWPAGGIGLAALLLHPRSLWPTLLSVMFGAGVAANLLSGRPVLRQWRLYGGEHRRIGSLRVVHHVVVWIANQLPACQ